MSGGNATPWLVAEEDGVVLHLRVQPRARITEVVGTHGSELKVRLAAPPVDGAANEALIAFLARTLEVRKRDVVLLSGHASRSKKVRVVGISGDDARTRLV